MGEKDGNEWGLDFCFHFHFKFDGHVSVFRQHVESRDERCWSRKGYDEI